MKYGSTRHCLLPGLSPGERMQAADVQHGQEIRADLPGIKVSATAGTWFGAREGGKGQVFFCTMGPIRVR